jgi:hypothetical protein
MIRFCLKVPEQVTAAYEITFFRESLRNPFSGKGMLWRLRIKI